MHVPFSVQDFKNIDIHVRSINMCINYSVKRFVAIIILYMIRKSNFENGPQGVYRPLCFPL